MSARDVMAEAILNAGMNMGALAHRTADTFEGKIVDFQIEALTAAGYTIIRDDENHKATVERCIEIIEGGFDKQVAEQFRMDGKPSKNDKCPHGFYMYEDCEACAVVALRSLIKEDGDAK